MKTFIFITILSLVNLFANANEYIPAINRDVKEIKSINEITSENQLFYGINIGRLFFNIMEYDSVLELSFNVSEIFLNKLENVIPEKIVFLNATLNIHIRDSYYLKVGIGSIKKDMFLSNVSKVEEKVVLKLKFSGANGYFVTDRFTMAAMFDSLSSAPSVQVGYVF
jgi:hypothetical protein